MRDGRLEYWAAARVVGRFFLDALTGSGGVAQSILLQGTATAAFEDGTAVELRERNPFHIPARPRDSWVVGDKPYVSLHFMGAEHYATLQRRHALTPFTPVR